MSTQSDNQGLQEVFNILEACAAAKLMLSLDGDSLRIRVPDGTEINKDLLAFIRG